jgi:cell division protein FtsI (penicillin-binding protein 3)
MSATTAEQLREMLEYVVSDGTARASKVEGYRAAGKTGTAEKIDPATGRYSKYVASFAGFAPVTDPRLSIVVVVDEPKGQYYGAEVAAPAFKRIAEQVLRLKSVPPDVPQYAPHYTAAPSRKKDKSAPQTEAKSTGFKVLEASLNESSGAFVPGGIVVPDFRGKSLREAQAETDRLGLAPASTGMGRIISQNPPPGAQVKPGARIRFHLSLE